MAPSIPTADTLLQHARFVRRIALALLRDEHAAEDVAQETWLAAFERPPRASGNLRGWLATVARRLAGRHRREEARRERRERAAARAEALPSMAETAARESALRRVTDAVLALDEPYRSTVLFRYYEGLDARSIARETSTPLATVRSRLQRALGRLREELDNTHEGDRRAWCLGLVSLLASRRIAIGASGLGAGAGTGVAIMGLKVKVAIGITAIGIGGLLGWQALLGVLAKGGSESVSERDEGVPAITAPESGEDAAELAPARAGTREPVAVAPPSELGALDVFVTWAATGEPAADREIRIYMSELPRVVWTSRRRTDADGYVHLDDVVPGEVWVIGDLGGHGSAPVGAGETARIDVAIPPGFRVRGRVLDLDGRGVPGASLWLSEYANDTSGAIVAQSGAAGRYEIADVPGDRYLGAIAAGHCPSHVHMLSQYQDGDERRDVELDLVLNGPGGAVHGLVVRSDGEPVPEARIHLVGIPPRELRISNALSLNTIPTFEAVTDETGRFAIEGLPLGGMTMTIGALGAAPFERPLAVVGDSPPEETFRLETHGVVHGLVTDADGEPVSEAYVRLDRESPLWISSDYADAKGRYRVENLPTGSVRLKAGAEDHGSAKVTLHLEPGAPLEWNPVLVPGRVVTGVVIDHEDRPLVGWYVTACAHLRTAAEWRRQAKTDEAGCFRIVDCREGPITLLVEEDVFTDRFPTLTEEIDGSTDEVVLRIRPEDRLTSGIRGRVLDPEGRPARAHVALMELEADHGQGYATDWEGYFAVERVRPGIYEFGIIPDEHPDLPMRVVELPPGQILDLGTRRLEEPGRLAVSVNGIPASENEVYHGFGIHYLVPDGRRPPSNLQSVRTSPLMEFPELNPGEYALCARARGEYASEVVPFVIESGRETTVEVTSRPGRRCRVGIEIPEGREAPRRARVVLLDDEGRTLLDVPWASGGREFEFTISLAFGAHHLDVSTPDGRSAAFDFNVVPDEAPGSDRFVFPLR